MYLTSAAIFLALGTWAQATTIRVVTVGASNGALTFSPNNTQAQAGDVVQFQFMPGNHSVAQADFSSPCMPVAQTQATTSGWWSGFMPMPANPQSMPVFSVPVKDANPVYFYCAQSNHCQSGMVGAINAPTSGSMSVDAFASAAKSAPQNMAPGQTSNSVSSADSSSTATTMATSTTSGSTAVTASSAPPINAASRTLAGVAKQSIYGASLAGLAAFLFL
ncbi:hypothetical protein EV356DRAFT_453829 [Viridothelium virens]|uniref:Phytocyanin domain-containing protein n=1 Tax=Viridothelium virens TaxID=1048519 RepID=A0A6A6GXA8_VIRVR|nr:hypothetical protein EV356DRAFT_453829 [Viridothelium virens]